MTEDQIREINTSELAAETMKLKNEGYRLIQMGVTGKSDGRWELTYSFGKDYEMTHLRMRVLPEEEVISISSIYEPAFLYENEMHDLFGVTITMIELDYHGNLYRLKHKTPYQAEGEE